MAVRDEIRLIKGSLFICNHNFLSLKVIVIVHYVKRNTFFRTDRTFGLKIYEPGVKIKEFNFRRTQKKLNF